MAKSERWYSEHTSTNEITIYRDAYPVAQIISQTDDIGDDEHAIAFFIINACNEKEDRS